MSWPERVLVVHNRYQNGGGEDAVFEAECGLLEAHGHRVLRYERHNRELDGAGRLGMARQAIWNGDVHAEIAALMTKERPQVVHVHNTLPIVSPAVHHAAKRAGAVVVQTLHNYRLLCPGGMFLRAGKPCELCLGEAVPWRGVAHACYRNDVAASAVVTGVLVAHRALGTWLKRVDAFIVLSEFAKSKFIAGGFAPERLHVKSGFLASDPGVGAHEGAEFLYVGRLSQEKGIDTLLDAWRHAPATAKLTILGDGPLAEQVRAGAATDPRIEWCGAVNRAEVIRRMQAAKALVFPSICYENFPTVLAEAYAVGLPLIASDRGSLPELVEHGVTGLRFPAGDAAALAAAIATCSADPALVGACGRAARRVYETRLTAQHAYARLLQIYARARGTPAAAPAAPAVT